jgi:hypothetical protein
VGGCDYTRSIPPDSEPNLLNASLMVYTLTFPETYGSILQERINFEKLSINK